MSGRVEKSHPFLLPAVLAVLAAQACGGGGGEREVSLPPPLVEALPARFGSLPVEESVPGVVRARNQVAIRPETSGRVVEVLARSGEAVQRGRPLVRIDAAELEERLRQAEADVRLAEAAAVAARARVNELETRVARTRVLADQSLVSAQELETLEAQLDALQASADEAAARVELARASVEERRSAVAKSVVRAPVSGRLGERRVEVGMQVDPDTVLFVVGDLAELIVEVTLTEEMLASVEEGQSVWIEPRAGAGEPVRAALSRISPFLAAQSFTTVGEIDVDNSERRLRPGMFVTVRILVGESRRATLVPVASVWESPRSGELGVYVVASPAGLEEPTNREPEAPEDPRRVAFRPVELLAEGRGLAGVSGIEPGTWVVTIGQHLLASDESGELVAKVRPVSWDRVLDLQTFQDEDLLEGFLDKQAKVAAAIGAEIPESEDTVDRILEEARAAAAEGPGES